MPWFPEFYSAVELARRQTRTAGLTDPVGQYINALNNGDTHVLEYTWPGAVTVYDPRAGEIRGHRKLRRFVLQNQTFLAERQARTETVATTIFQGERSWSCWCIWMQTTRNTPGRWRSSPIPRTICRWYFAPTAADGRWTGGASSGGRFSVLGNFKPGDVVGRYLAAWKPVTPRPP